MNRRLITLAFTFLLLLAANSCKKVCSSCPDGECLVVDNPKDEQCFCCPEGYYRGTEDGLCYPDITLCESEGNSACDGCK